MKWQGRRQSTNVIEAKSRRAKLYNEVLSRSFKRTKSAGFSIEGVGPDNITRAAVDKKPRLLPVPTPKPSRKKRK